MLEELPAGEFSNVDPEQLLMGLLSDLYSPIHNISQCVQFIVEDPDLQLSPDGKKILDFLLKDAKRLQTYFDDTRKLYTDYQSSHLSHKRSQSDH